MKTETILEKKREIEDQIQQAKLTVSNLPNMHSKGVELAEWRGRLENLVYICGNDMEKVMKTRADDYRKIKSTVDQLNDEVQLEKKKADDARAHLAALEAELAKLPVLVSLKELLAFRKEVEQSENTVHEIEGLMKEQQSKIDGVNDTGGTLDACSQLLVSLHEQKENILADIACGKDTDKEQIAVLDEQITEAKAQHDEHIKSTAIAAQTLSGLHRKLSAATSELTVAKRNYLDAAAVFLDSEIENAGIEYVKTSDQAAAQFMRVVSLAELRGKIGKPTNVFGPYTGRCQLPSFALEICQANEQAGASGYLFKYEGGNTAEFLKNEIERLQTLGLELPL